MGLTELFTQKDVLQQFAANPLSVLLTMVVISVATIIPIKKVREGNGLENSVFFQEIPISLNFSNSVKFFFFR